MSSIIIVPKDNTSFRDIIFTNEGHLKGFYILLGNRNRSQVPTY